MVKIERLSPAQCGICGSINVDIVGWIRTEGFLCGNTHYTKADGRIFEVSRGKGPFAGSMGKRKVFESDLSLKEVFIEKV